MSVAAGTVTDAGRHGVGHHGHVVAFYDADTELIDHVTAFVADGMRYGASAVVVATGPHRDAIDSALADQHVDTGRAAAQGRYVVLDAAQTLASFTTDGRLDEPSFAAIVGGILAGAARAGTPVRVFGEMVALLWDEENVAAAMELESFWNRLARTHDFRLLCGYPQTALEKTALTDAAEVCRVHTDLQVLEGEQPPFPLVTEGDVHTSGVLVPTALSIRTARRFIAATIGTMAGQDVLDNAALIVTELATNAVRHAATAFRVSATHLGSRVRLAVEDVGPGQPQLSVAGPLEVSGRGLALTAMLADHWGWDDVPGGKVVWAELLITVA